MKKTTKKARTKKTKREAPLVPIDVTLTLEVRGRPVARARAGLDVPSIERDSAATILALIPEVLNAIHGPPPAPAPSSVPSPGEPLCDVWFDTVVDRVVTGRDKNPYRAPEKFLRCSLRSPHPGKHLFVKCTSRWLDDDAGSAVAPDPSPDVVSSKA